MLNFLKKLFGVPEAKPVETTEANVSAPYKVPEPAATTPIPLVVNSAPAVETVVVVPEAVVPAGVVEQAPISKKPKAPAKLAVPFCAHINTALWRPISLALGAKL